MSKCKTTCACSCQETIKSGFVKLSDINTLTFNAARCINCGMCSTVCPHGVFIAGERIVQIIHPEACMECGACQRNCPVGAIEVDSGVGCATAMIYAALTGKAEPTCGDADTAPACCP
jgi:NAD-dependent dihydropyrimidine dehydrogenase PreA subunit